MLCQKHLFNIDPAVTFLNCAFISPVPIPVAEAGRKGIDRESHVWTITAEDFFKPVDLLKERFARLIRADDHNRIAILPSVSYGMASVMKNLPLRPGQHIVVLEEQFPSNYYTWHRLAKEKGAALRVVPSPDRLEERGRKWNEKLLDSIDRETAAVALPHVHWTDGTKFDLMAVRERTKEVGARMIVDGSQSVGALPFDVSRLQPDALVCAGYKWLFGPYGMGLAYYGPEMDDGIPIEENWINRLNSDDFQSLVNFQPAYRPLAHRYNVGECSRFIEVPMMTEALDLLLEWGVENVQDYCSGITEELLPEIQECGFWVENKNARGAHLFGIRLPSNVNMERLRHVTASEKLFISFRGNAVRISPNVYNDKADIEKLVEALRKCLS